MSAVRFSKQYVQPKPHEVDYWVDLATNPYGAVIKYYNGDDWEQWEGSGGQSSNFDVYTKKQINEMLAKKANVGDVDSKVDDDELAEVIKNIKIKEIGNDGVALVLFKYDNTNLAVTLPTATATNAGVLSGKDFANFVKQHQLQALYSEMYDLFADIRSKYQRKLKAGRNIKITSDNVISAEINVGPGSYDVALNELDEKINTETERAIAVEDRLEKRVDQHYVETDNLFVLKANKADVYTKSQVDNKLTGVYKVKGSKTYEKLPTSNSVGDVYNITNQFTLNGTTYPEGTNVVYTEYGWDALSGNFDVTALEEDIQTVADGLSKETLRAIGAETYNSNSIINLTNTAAELTTKLNTLTGNVYTVALVDDIVDGYLPLTGGTLTNALFIDRDALIGLYLNNTGVTNNLGASMLMFRYKDTNAVGIMGVSNGVLLRVTSDFAHKYTIWDEGNDGSGSGLDADMLDGKHISELSSQIFKRGSVPNLASTDDLNDFTFKNNKLGYYTTNDNVRYTNSPYVNFGLLCVSLNESYTGQLVFGYNNQSIKYRSQTYNGTDIVWNDWRTVAFTDSNVASATKLQTPRTIWGQSFDGTGNVSGNMTGLALMKNLDDIEVLNTGFYGNSVCLGYGTSEHGSNTLVDGNVVVLRYGTTHTTGLFLNNSGNITIGSSDLASTDYKLYVNGMSYFSSQMNVVGNFYKYNAAGTYRLSLVNDSDYCSIYNIKADGSAYGNLVFQGNIGIGTTRPLHKLHVEGTAYATKFTMSSQTAEVTGIARNWADTYTDSASNARPWCGLSTVPGMKNFEETTLTSYFGMLFKTGGSSFPFIFNGGKIGIWTNTPTEALHVNGNILATGTINQESQRDLKNIIDEKVLSLDDMNTINPTRFTWKDNRDEDIHYGGIAEDIQQVIPEVVHKSGDNLTVEYANAAFAMVTSLVKHVKDLEQRLSKLEEDYKQLLLNNKQ